MRWHEFTVGTRSGYTRSFLRRMCDDAKSMHPRTKARMPRDPTVALVIEAHSYSAACEIAAMLINNEVDFEHGMYG